MHSRSSHACVAQHPHVGQLTQCLAPEHRAFAWEYNDGHPESHALFGCLNARMLGCCGELRSSMSTLINVAGLGMLIMAAAFLAAALASHHICHKLTSNKLLLQLKVEEGEPTPKHCMRAAPQPNASDAQPKPHCR